jgi:hypothetical protein
MNPHTLTASGAAWLITFGYLAGYALLCAASPFGPCRRCHGRPAPARRPLTLARIFGALLGTSRYPRVCRRCHGTGIRQRYGRRLYHYLRRLTQDAR